MAVGAVNSSTSQVSQASLGSQDLFSILLTQLNYQDPLKPMDNQEFMAQLAQFTQLEQTRQINEKIDDLLMYQASTQAVGLLGHTVEAQTETDTIVGEVSTVTYSGGTPTLTLKKADGTFLSDIRLSQVYIIN